MSIIKSAVKTGIAVKAFDLARREMRKPENQRKAKELLAKAQHEFRKPQNQQKAKDVLSKVTKRTPGR
ncbi:MAG: hypothetical protein H0T66_03790 [Geodermatophilaceae bacterium]|jgi:hypothetical protein|nr:hypothetical protein [Geodermatophilaceae bacterium]MDQ3456123.1 hypothetical protein [Actinomycetota bacterium]